MNICIRFHSWSLSSIYIRHSHPYWLISLCFGLKIGKVVVGLSLLDWSCRVWKKRKQAQNPQISPVLYRLKLTWLLPSSTWGIQQHRLKNTSTINSSPCHTQHPCWRWTSSLVYECDCASHWCLPFNYINPGLVLLSRWPGRLQGTTLILHWSWLISTLPNGCHLSWSNQWLSIHTHSSVSTTSCRPRLPRSFTCSAIIRFTAHCQYLSNLLPIRYFRAVTSC